MTAGPGAVPGADARTERAVALAGRLLAEAQADETRGERRRRARLGRLLADPEGPAFTLALTDEVVRIRDPARAARRLADLVADGLPAALGPLDRLALVAAGRLAPRLPRVVLPLVVARLRQEAAGTVLPAGRRPLARHLRARRAAGVRLNVNLLGEAVLGHAEAARRLEAVLELVARPGVDYVSVKASALAAQLRPVALEAEVERLAVPLRRLYDAARTSTPPVFVNLDMEEHRDLELTTAVFRRVLDEPAYGDLSAGIVLQAYLPDAHDALAGLCDWAVARHARAGGTVKVRVVKGANLAMERVDGELHGWPQAPYPTKVEVDASFKRLVEHALDPRHADAVRLGVASHNLFDLGWALSVAEELGATGRVDVEMLEGMAPPQARAVRRAAGDLLLYAPVVHRDDFDAAIAYLVRRLDENTAPENFLHDLFTMTPGSPAWHDEEARFRAALARVPTVSIRPRRTQDRDAPDVPPCEADGFANEADTDWSVPANRRWVEHHLAAGRCRPAAAEPVADLAAVERAVAAAVAAAPAWAARPRAGRRAVLHRVADELAGARGELLATMASEGAKVVTEGDPEVSEAVDFARWCAGSTRLLDDLEGDGLRFEPYRTVVVASPWNFPLAIPAGGVLAALAAGSAVILKPAPETVRTARLLAERCWAAGVPEDVLGFLPCPDGDVGRRLITHPDVDAVVLTGAYETAQRFLDWRPTLRLHAETSGKNAVVITAAADLDLAVRDLVASAFGHAGQKCSAASLAIVEASVHDDPGFRRRLADAASSLVVGPADDLRTVVGPLIHPPEGPLAEALERLGPGESWLVAPRALDADGDRRLWSPGVKLGVSPGSAFFMTECFGPVLGVVRARDLDHAVELQNGTDFGLTAGLCSLDEVEVATWLERVEAGNAYVNRPTTGAIVRRQPFGGWKRSSVGPTFKAGGPNHVLSLGRWTDVSVAGEDSFERWWAEELSLEHDPSGLTAERNVLRYRPYPRGVLLRAGPGVADEVVARAERAAAVVGTPVVVSRAGDEPEDALAARLGDLRVDKLRLLGPAGEGLWRAAHAAAVPVDDSPVVGHGRIELLRWVREQAVSATAHRYGNLVDPGQPRRSRRASRQKRPALTGLQRTGPGPGIATE